MENLDTSIQWVKFFFPTDSYPTAQKKNFKLLIDHAYAYIFTNENPLTHPVSGDLKQFEFRDALNRPILVSSAYKQTTDEYEIEFWLATFEEIGCIPMLPELSQLKTIQT